MRVTAAFASIALCVLSFVRAQDQQCEDTCSNVGNQFEECASNNPTDEQAELNCICQPNLISELQDCWSCADLASSLNESALGSIDSIASACSVDLGGLANATDTLDSSQGLASITPLITDASSSLTAEPTGSFVTSDSTGAFTTTGSSSVSATSASSKPASSSSAATSAKVSEGSVAVAGVGVAALAGLFSLMMML